MSASHKKKKKRTIENIFSSFSCRSFGHITPYQHFQRHTEASRLLKCRKHLITAEPWPSLSQLWDLITCKINTQTLALGPPICNRANHTSHRISTDYLHKTPGDVERSTLDFGTEMNFTPRRNIAVSTGKMKGNYQNNFI